MKFHFSTSAPACSALSMTGCGNDHSHSGSALMPFNDLSHYFLFLFLGNYIHFVVHILCTERMDLRVFVFYGRLMPLRCIKQLLVIFAQAIFCALEADCSCEADQRYWSMDHVTGNQRATLPIVSVKTN